MDWDTINRIHVPKSTAPLVEPRYQNASQQTAPSRTLCQIRLDNGGFGGQKNRFKDHIKSIQKFAKFHLTGWKLSHPTELPADLHVPLECHALTQKSIELLLSDSVADNSMLQCQALFRIMFINAFFVADYASHILAFSATEKPTFNDEEEVVVIGNGWTSKKKITF